MLPVADEDATVTIDDKLLSNKINAMLKDGFAKRIGGGEFTGPWSVVALDDGVSTCN